jgi:hypothetical protein
LSNKTTRIKRYIYESSFCSVMGHLIVLAVGFVDCLDTGIHSFFFFFGHFFIDCHNGLSSLMSVQSLSYFTF